MTFLEFLRDKLLLLLFHMLCMLLSFIYFSICGLKNNQMFLLYILWFFLLAVWFFVSWYRRNRYFREIFQILDELDKPYLISEVMPDSWRLEDRLCRRLLKQSNKSVIDAIHHLENERTEYKEFIENWIHEVKLPLTAMNLICDNRKRKDSWCPEDTRRLKSLLGELENDVDKALYYARSDTVCQDYMIREIPLKEVVLAAIHRIQSYLIQNGAVIDMQVGDVNVYCDDKWLEFILNQIFLNAVKYKKEDVCRISIDTSRENNCTALTVEDNGIGILDSEIGRIFDKGFTGTNGRHNRQSTGIGLYLCRKLCRKLGISIEARSKEGEYTKILLHFPDGSSHFSRDGQNAEA